MPPLTRWALEQGFDGPALRNLAGPATATLSNEPIEAALREHGKEPLERIEAGRWIATLACKQILAGAVSPFGGAFRVWSVYDRCGCPKALRPYVGYANEWEDDPEHRDHYDKLIVKTAQTLLRQPPQF
jgi:hypothetical protein